ncbi:MAG: Lrp/AsnC family transcriptional regulator [Gammaproteobacteria bacterium]|nr:Lrp/AsnC family transcriptional regulator [Gammaproteobacteria bacterium]
MMKFMDQQLIAKLRENARRSTSEIARELGVSRSTVNSRIKRLEDTGVIKGYTLEYGEDYANQLVNAHVLIKVNQKLTARTNRDLHQVPQIRAVFAISGDYDLIAEIEAESTANLSQILDLIGNFEGVERTNSSLILETKFRR